MGHGRRVDRDIAAHFNKTANARTLSKDARAVLRRLKEKRWKIVACQYRVADRARHTFIDIVCKSPRGSVVIIEMKTTLQNWSKYRKFYRQPDALSPKMTDGTTNSKYWRHQKQLAGNIKLWRAQEGKRQKVIGVVLVVCRGATALIPLARSLANTL
jgi:hypothetical protein